jgi:hypothetical protein
MGHISQLVRSQGIVSTNHPGSPAASTADQSAARGLGIGFTRFNGCRIERRTPPLEHHAQLISTHGKDSQ